MNIVSIENNFPSSSIHLIIFLDRYHRIRLVYEHRSGGTLSSFDSNNAMHVSEHQNQFQPFPVISGDRHLAPRYSEEDLQNTIRLILHGVIVPHMCTLTGTLVSRDIQLVSDQLVYFQSMRISMQELMVECEQTNWSRHDRRRLIRAVNHLFVRFDHFTTEMMTRAQRNELLDHNGFTGWNQNAEVLRGALACSYQFQ